MAQHIPLPPGSTPESLKALGLSRTSIWRALRRGWYTVEYHNGSRQPEPACTNRYEHPQADGLGMFATFTNPEGFVRMQISGTFALFDPLAISSCYMEEQDWVQQGLLKLWEERHTPGIKNPQAWFACRLRSMAKDGIKKALRRAALDRDFEYHEEARLIEERLAGVRPLDMGEMPLIKE